VRNGSTALIVSAYWHVMDYDGTFAWKMAAMGGVLDFTTWDGALY